MDPFSTAEALAHSLSAYFFYLNSIIHLCDPYANLYPYSYLGIFVRDADIIAHDGRRVDQVAFRFTQEKYHHPYSINTYIPVCIRATSHEFRFHTLPHLMQRHMRHVTLTRALLNSQVNVYPVEWQVSTDPPPPMHRTYGVSECHIFTGYTGHRRTDPHAAESIMGYVFLEAFSESDIRIHVVFRGSQSGDTSRTARLLLQRSGNPDWLTDLNFDFVNFLGHRLPHGMNAEFESWRQRALDDLHANGLFDVPVHEGFRQAFFSCLPALRKIFMDIALRYPTCHFENMTATGHSLGGALAQLFWYATTLKDFIFFMTNGVVDHAPLAQAIIFSAPHIWHQTLCPSANGRVIAFEINGDQVVHFSFKIRCAYPRFTQRVQLDQYDYENINEMGWPHLPRHSHDPVALIESLSHERTLKKARLVLSTGEKKFLSMNIADYISAMRVVFPPKSWRGQETFCHYIHIFREKNFLWTSALARLSRDEQNFFAPYRRSLIFYGILEDMRETIVKDILPHFLIDFRFSLHSIARRLSELLQMLHASTSVFEIQNIKKFLIKHLRLYPELRIIIQTFLEIVERLIEWYKVEY